MCFDLQDGTYDKEVQDIFPLCNFVNLLAPHKNIIKKTKLTTSWQDVESSQGQASPGTPLSSVDDFSPAVFVDGAISPCYVGSPCSQKSTFFGLPGLTHGFEKGQLESGLWLISSLNI